MYTLDEKEVVIARELIKNPRISDNALSKKTGIPLKTVNRKRKILEEKGHLSYFVELNNNSSGTEIFSSRKIYITKLKHSITKLIAVAKTKDENYNLIKYKHMRSFVIGEMGGAIALIFEFESRLGTDIIEIYNADIVSWIKELFGNDAIQETKVIDVLETVRVFHNYLPLKNMEKGRIKKDWPEDWIFVQ